jgi:ABC-type nickel/cobalt efflux system permease component RcnA
MVVLGLLLVAAAAVFGTEMVLSNTDVTTAEAFNETVANVSAAEFFLVGAACALALCLGLWLISHGIGRSRRRRAMARHAVNEKTTALRETEGELTGIAEENERLRAELAEERRNRLTMGGAVVPPPVTAEGTAYDTQTYDVDTDQTIDLDGDRTAMPNETFARETRTFDPYPANGQPAYQGETVDETALRDSHR